MNKEFGRVAISVVEPQGADGAAYHTRFERRDDIAAELKAEGVAILSRPTDSPTLVIACSGETQRILPSLYSGVTVRTATL